jgi:hypothetical protein
MPALASSSRVVAGDDRWLSVAVGGHLGKTLHLLGDGHYARAVVLAFG